MERLASRWKLVLLITALAGVAIFACYPDYNTVQMAKDANDFTSTLGDDEGRAIAANLSDMVFTLSYGLLGVIAFRKLATGNVALIGTLLAAGAALADEIENVLVFLNLKSDSLTNGDVDTMTTVGLVKWVLVIATLALLLAVAVRRRNANAS